MDENIDSRLIEVPYQRLSEEALQGVLEEYATRGGYECSIPLQKKIDILKHRLAKGELVIVFDPAEEGINIIEKGARSHD
ncbi:MAG: YheU family protein [Candidatus Bruticola sp.]